MDDIIKSILNFQYPIGLIQQRKDVTPKAIPVIQ